MGYFAGMGGSNPGMLMSPYASQMNPQALAMMAQMQSQGQGGGGQPPGGAAPQMPPVQKAQSNAGAMPSPIGQQPQNPMIQQLMQNPQALQNLLKSIGGGGAGGLLGGNQPGAFGSSWLTPNMAQNAWNSMGG